MANREIHSWLMDMDGVLVHEAAALPGADRFLARLNELQRPYLLLTNNSIYTAEPGASAQAAEASANRASPAA